MTRLHADQLKGIIERAKAWPVWGSDAQGTTPGMENSIFMQAGTYGESMRDLALYVALRESDRERLKSLTGWKADREIKIDSLPERIANAYSDLLYGENAEFTAGELKDQDQMDEMVKANDLQEELPRWVDWCVSEGEVWWRVYVDRDISEFPIIEANSRLDVIPMFSGRKITAAAFTTDIFSQNIEVEKTIKTVVWRHIEIQTDGLVYNLLYKGDLYSLGDEQPLGSLPETANLPPEWKHGLDIMLAGRIPNKLGRDYRLGISEYHGVKDLLLDLNESHTIMSENARNTAKARMVVPASAIGEDGTFDATKDIVVEESQDDSLDNAGKSGSYTVLEYKFQARELLMHMDNLVDVIMTRCGLAEQFVGGGKSSQGQAFTGTALRTRLIPTTLAASKKGKIWDRGVKEMLFAAMQAAALPTERGGTGHTWTDKTLKPEIKRSSVLPEDQNEQTQRLVMAVQGEIMSINTALKTLHPDWTEDEIKEELEAIQNDRAPATPFGQTLADVQNGRVQLPDQMDSKPGDSVPTPDPNGARQPGAGRTPDGQSPGKKPPVVTAGGPR